LTAGAGQVLVVGGAKGIGLATARDLVSAGYRVAVWDNDVAALGRLGHGFATAALDITNRSAVADALKMLRSAGALRAAVIAAGIHASCPGEFLPDAVLDRIMNVNFTAHAKLARDLVPLMVKGGRIIGVSSIAASVGMPMSAAYSASKAALEAFYASLTSDLRHKSIWPVIVQPGNVNTGFNETGNDFASNDDARVATTYRAVVETIHSRNGMPPTDVAAVICQAIAAPRPKFLYVVGRNAQRANLARRLLGYNGALYFVRRHFGIS